jgi:prepilin-type N-terminal cleavage/methylation domain-containing protein
LIRITRSLQRSDRGFSLVEVLVALVVFTIVTLGVIPLLLTSLRGTNVSRSSNVAKNIAVKAMERVRGLPYHIGYTSQPDAGGGGKVDVDVLDLYLPGETQPTITTCDSTTDADPRCPKNIPEGHTLTFVARFVDASGTTDLNPADYDWDADDPSNLVPPNLVRMVVRVQWGANFGPARDYQLETLVGDRRFARLNVKGLGKVNFGLRVGTSVSDGTTRRDLTVTAVNAESEIETRTNSEADQLLNAGTLSLVNASDPTSVLEVLGASASFHAPPGSDESDVSASGGTIMAPGVGDVAGIDATVAGEPAVDGDISLNVASQRPRGQGGVSYDVPTSTLDLWVDNPQADRVTGPGAVLDLKDGSKILSIETLDNDVDADSFLETLEGYSDSTTGAADVSSLAHVELEQLRLFPTNFVFSQNPDFGGALIVIDEFVADVNCQSFTNNVASAAADITWTATLRFWSEERDGERNGSYKTVTLTGDGATDPLADFSSTTNNPLVFESIPPAPLTGPQSDLFLFGTSTETGYLESWSSTVGLDPAGTDVSGDGRSTSATLDGALRIDTVPLPADFEEFPLALTLGSLSCEAVDFR